MRLVALILVGIAALANASGGDCNAADRDAYHDLYFYTNANDIYMTGPCERVATPGNNICTTLEPGSIAATAKQIRMPVGEWTCNFYHGQTCTGESHSQWGSGVALPPDWQGKLGAFSCVRTW